jgi:hypothetical protein
MASFRARYCFVCIAMFPGEIWTGVENEIQIHPCRGTLPHIMDEQGVVPSLHSSFDAVEYT